MKHISVFKNKVSQQLDVKPDGTYVDLTLGAGGHAGDILKQLKSGTLVAFDMDKLAIANFQSVAAKASKATVHLVNRNFSELHVVLAELGLAGVDGIVADLGWSSDQLGGIPGLSYQEEEELDMRFDQTLSVKAKDLLNGLHKKELLVMFDRYADIRGAVARKLADAIIEIRNRKPFENTSDLKRLIENSGNLPARVFQALRIAVNSELSSLQSMLPQAWSALVPGGTLIVITFHSGEERVVKEVMGNIQAGVKPVRPDVDELRENIRAHSAKLWVYKKLK
jgi:16S rRNA (cytosine1402-N4)-methyltransferase